MQASGRRLGMVNIAKILYQDEGLFRFWKGAQVMASGCVPAHASYFVAYEHLKTYFHFNNESMNFSSTLFIGGFTTFAHDFFISPADSKSLALQSLSFPFPSDETKTTVMQESDSYLVL